MGVDEGAVTADKLLDAGDFILGDIARIAFDHGVVVEGNAEYVLVLPFVVVIALDEDAFADSDGIAPNVESDVGGESGFPPNPSDEISVDISRTIRNGLSEPGLERFDCLALEVVQTGKRHFSDFVQGGNCGLLVSRLFSKYNDHEI